MDVIFGSIYQYLQNKLYMQPACDKKYWSFYGAWAIINRGYKQPKLQSNLSHKIFQGWVENRFVVQDWAEEEQKTC